MLQNLVKGGNLEHLIRPTPPSLDAILIEKKEKKSRQNKRYSLDEVKMFLEVI